MAGVVPSLGQRVALAHPVQALTRTLQTRGPSTWALWDTERKWKMGYSAHALENYTYQHTEHSLSYKYLRTHRVCLQPKGNLI